MTLVAAEVIKKTVTISIVIIQPSNLFLCKLLLKILLFQSAEHARIVEKLMRYVIEKDRVVDAFTTRLQKDVWRWSQENEEEGHQVFFVYFWILLLSFSPLYNLLSSF